MGRSPRRQHVEQAIARLPRVPLVDVEPPLHDAGRLSARTGARRILIKRDDLIGRALGGNKVRSLEFLLGEALALDSDVLVTGAGPQSNHVRATAILGRMLGLEVIAVLWGSAPAEPLGNLRLIELSGAQVVWTGRPDRTSVDEAIEATAETLRRRGRRPYVIPRGGASPLAAIAHLSAAMRVADQLVAMDHRVDRIVLAAGSGATAAGWLLWRALDAPTHAISAWSVSRPVADTERQILQLAQAAAALLGLDVSEGALRDGVEVRDAVGPGYGIPSPSGNAALDLVLETEAIVLDPTYTAKAFAGWLELCRGEPAEHDRTVLFLHSGGLPAVFAARTQA